MLLYTLTKKFIENSKIHVKSIWYHIVLQSRWFDGQNIGVEPRKPTFNSLYQHMLCGI
jgi:hypothetical protein